MAIRDIVKDGDPLLRKKSHPVEKFDGRLHALLDDMLETMRSADGVGIAAPQVGILRRAVICELEVPGKEEGEILEMINPLITEKSGEQVGAEGCLSVPGRNGITKRPMKVTVKAQDRNGNWCVYQGEGLKARCFCHELDHLDGILFTDNMIEEVRIECNE